MHLRDIDDAKDVTGLAGLNQQPEVERTMRTDGPRAEDVGRARRVIIIAGIFGGAGILDFVPRLDVLQQARLHFQDGLGIVVEIGIGIRPRHQGCREERRKDCRGEINHAMFHIRLDATG